jgi:hypothetical protein
VLSAKRTAVVVVFFRLFIKPIVVIKLKLSIPSD